MTNFAIARRNMVESQLRTNKLTSTALIEAFSSVPRELFVPKAYRGLAYIDEDLAIGGGRYLMEPVVLARLLQEARIAPEDSVLDIGCATGYSTAIIARLAGSVLGLDDNPDFAEEANRILTDLGADNAAAVDGAMLGGYPQQAPYNVIVLNGAVDSVPPTLVEQLSEGGRLVAVIRQPSEGVGRDVVGVGRATIVTKNAGAVAHRVLFDAATPMLPGFAREPGFAF
ncbi:protein-L-isoaspartate O-methyltransferase family protein [Oceanibaculum pacificum]|uniref:Protein-L-isoaspartate O-methyltransferase n=1 Tax=Oceanibaculum pacificum TaxID=580166 RepID=A0A154W2E4_9PROT|nr:protein-L-isoaspartate O-methyltransferase [Oceanibaculum pacificum]KZD07680.1 protein-L-isoaspartate O-methyltransferase [Oceanibaculum pacificum]